MDTKRLLDLYTIHQSLSKVAIELNVTKAAVSYALKKLGVITSKPTAKTAITRQEIEVLLQNGNTIAGIARQENVSSTIIKRILKDKTRVRVNVIPSFL